MRRNICAIVIVAAACAPAWADQPMKAADIQRDIIGKRIYLAAPFGGELPLHYNPGGQVDGSGEAIGLGKWLKPNDTGKWWISGDKLCQQFKTWYNGAKMCFDLNRKSATSVLWRRDDGESGVARIGN